MVSIDGFCQFKDYRLLFCRVLDDFILIPECYLSNIKNRRRGVVVLCMQSGQQLVQSQDCCYMNEYLLKGLN